MSAEIVVREPETEPTAASTESAAPPPNAPESPTQPGGAREDRAVVQPACPACGAPMAADQDWCLECGSRRSARSGLRSAGWRGGAAALVATGILASGAVAAAYAGLSADNHAVKVASAP